MNENPSMADKRGAGQAAGDEVVALVTGAAFTFALFLGLAHVEHFGEAEPAAEIADLRMAAVPVEPPPPPPRQDLAAQEPESALPLAGIEAAASESPVSIAVVPPDIESMFPTTSRLPNARIQFDLRHTDLRPKAAIELDVRQVYQDSEVDQKPRVLVCPVPPIPSDVSGNAPVLRVGLILLIGRDGKPESVRVAESSGNPRFDEIVSHTVRQDWLFSPAIRQGKKVRVMAQQGFRFRFSSGGGSPFSLN